MRAAAATPTPRHSLAPGNAERDVIAYGDIEELRILEDEGDVPVEDVGSNGSHINASNTHTALVWISKAGNQRLRGWTFQNRMGR